MRFLQAVLDFLDMANVAGAGSGSGARIRTRGLYLEVVISLTITMETQKTFTHMKVVPGRGFGQGSERLRSPLHVNQPCVCNSVLIVLATLNSLEGKISEEIDKYPFENSQTKAEMESKIWHLR